MKCKEFNDLDGCGKCVIKLSDSTNIKDLTVLSMSDVINSIMTFLINNTDKKLELETSTITCNGHIELTYSGNKDKNYTNTNRCAFKRFLSHWYKYYKVVIFDALALVYMSKLLSVLDLPAPDNELIKRATELDTAMEALISKK